MKRDDLLQRQHEMLTCLSHLPKKILALHDKDNVTEFVLHDLCHEHCFNLNRAAYFVDSPDFNCVKGVAGFCRSEAYANCESVWEKPEEFSVHMQSAPFNQRVRGISRCSIRKSEEKDEVLAQELARDLGFKNYDLCSWGMKHDNHGFVLLEKACHEDKFADEYVLDGLSLLSFCPVF